MGLNRVGGGDKLRNPIIKIRYKIVLFSFSTRIDLLQTEIS